LANLEKRLAQKIEERNLQGRLSDVMITAIDFGSHAPSLSNFQVSAPLGLRPDDEPERQRTHDLCVEFDVAYADGDASFGLGTVLSLTIKQLKLHVLITLVHLSGRAMLCCPPHPFGQCVALPLPRSLRAELTRCIVVH